MGESTTTSSGTVKAFAIRLNETVRTQLDIIAQLNDRTVTDEIRLAIEAWIEKTRSDPSVREQAEAVRNQIEREAAIKRAAIAEIFPDEKKPAGARKAPTRSSSNSAQSTGK